MTEPPVSPSEPIPENVPPLAEAFALPEIETVPLDWPAECRSLPRFDRPLEVSVRQATLLASAPWVRALGKLTLDVAVQGWRFPTPPDQALPVKTEKLALLPFPQPEEVAPPAEQTPPPPGGGMGGLSPPTPLGGSPGKTRLKPPADAVMFKDRLLYLLQPPLEDIFAGRQVQLPFQPFPYQVKGIAFLMPRHNALLADEMGLGKTIQVIVSLRLLFHAGAIKMPWWSVPSPW